jgi:hypothetical protein
MVKPPPLKLTVRGGGMDRRKWRRQSVPPLTNFYTRPEEPAGEKDERATMEFSKRTKRGRCEHCQCDGLLKFYEPLDMYLCYDCDTNCQQSDEVHVIFEPCRRCGERAYENELCWECMDG